MIILSLVLLIVGILLIITGMFMLEERTTIIVPVVATLGLALILISIIIGIAEKSDSNVPTALDVYRGNTTLEITYRDSVAIDSVVVFKNK